MSTPTTSTPARQDRISLERRAPSAGGLNTRFVYIEIKRLVRNKRTVIFTLLLPAVFFLAFGLPNMNQHLPNGQSYGSYILISLAVYGAMTASTAAYITVKALSSLSLALLSVIAEFVVGFAFGVRMGWSIWLVSGLVAWLGSLIFAALGLFMGYLVPSQNVMQLLGPILAVPAMMGGLFVLLSVMGDTFGKFAAFTPAHGIGQLARSPLTGDFSWMWVLNIALWLAVFTAGAALAFRRDTKRV